MIIYNVTIKVQASIHQEWLVWLKTDHIPAILNTGCFTHSNILEQKDLPRVYVLLTMVS